PGGLKGGFLVNASGFATLRKLFVCPTAYSAVKRSKSICPCRPPTRHEMACAADPAVSLLLAKSVAVTDSRAPDRGVLEAAPSAGRASWSRSPEQGVRQPPKPRLTTQAPTTRPAQSCRARGESEGAVFHPSLLCARFAPHFT